MVTFFAIASGICAISAFVVFIITGVAWMVDNDGDLWIGGSRVVALLALLSIMSCMGVLAYSEIEKRLANTEQVEVSP